VQRRKRTCPDFPTILAMVSISLRESLQPRAMLPDMKSFHGFNFAVGMEYSSTSSSLDEIISTSSGTPTTCMGQHIATAG